MRRALLGHAWLQTVLWIAIAVALNHLAAAAFVRVDVTGDQRFSLAETSRRTVATLDKPLLARVFFTDDLDPPYHNHEAALLDLLAELQAWSDGRLEIVVTDPTGDQAAMEEARRFGVGPVTYTRQEWDRQEARQVFMGVSFVYGDRQQAVGALPSVERMEYEVVRAIRAITTEPDDRRTVGWLQGNGEPDPAAFPDSDPLGRLRASLAAEYHLVPVSLSDGPIPEHVDALLVVGPQLGVPESAQLHLDQFLMRGGGVAWFLAGYQPDFRTMQLREIRHDLHGLLGHYGVKLGRDVLLDRKANEAMVVPVAGGQLARVSYPLALVTTAIDRIHGPVRDLPRAVLPFATPLEIVEDPTGAREAAVWIRSGPNSVAAESLRSLAPADLAAPGPGETTGPFPVAVAVSGSFPSRFAERPPAGVDPAELLVESAPTRMVVVSSADMVANNLPFVQNAVDWLLEDPSLVGIRSRAVGDPPLTPPDAAAAWRWKLAMGGLPIALVWALGLAVWLRGRR